MALSAGHMLKAATASGRELARCIPASGVEEDPSKYSLLLGTLPEGSLSKPSVLVLPGPSQAPRLVQGPWQGALSLEPTHWFLGSCQGRPLGGHLQSFLLSLHNGCIIHGYSRDTVKYFFKPVFRVF
uniref:Uncharacterized protein n=1 Tax=Pipistrellus kuhlii TaxID=59472 RepID=A0A7J7XUW1_PIPKU|nr:hypothetical protein mPipKuh1_010413 [Pipistrellus kuhlii]